jgi:calcineurin-like phosphoesterase family protein
MKTSQKIGAAVLVVAAVAVVLALVRRPAVAPSPSLRPGSPPPAGTIRIAAAGDIASGSCCDDQTAALITSMAPAAVLTLGDNQYEDGEYSAYLEDYDTSWGAFKDTTFPSPGNHDYHTAGAAGYFRYFGDRAPAEYYTYVLGGWRFLSMNNYVSVDAQTAWLSSTLASDDHRCELAYWHEPRWSSGSHHGSSPDLQPWWEAAVNGGVDVVLSGHDHEYERFAPLDGSGQVASTGGTREFVVGTGGNELYSFTTPLTGSEVRIAEHGVLFLNLGATSYSWEFEDVNGNVLDRGSTPCA